jgi:hypothetical protein
MNLKIIVPRIQTIVPKIQTHRPQNFKTPLKPNSRVPSSSQARRLGFESTAKKWAKEVQKSVRQTRSATALVTRCMTCTTL